MRPTLEERFTGCVLGLAVGDTLGAEFEGRSPESIAHRYQLPHQLIHSPPPGLLSYTDDTQLAIGVAETLVACGRIDELELRRRFAENFEPTRGYGRGARKVIEAMRSGIDHVSLAETCFPGGSFGNGAAMRSAPIGLAFRHDLQLLWEQARLASLPTHVHPLGIEGAQLIAMSVALACNMGEFNRLDYFERLGTAASHVEYSGPIRRAARITDRGDLALFGNGIAATDSVVTAIAAFGLTPNDFGATIANVILLGGDTDTIAAMAGAISGAYLGIGAIPQHLLDYLEDGEKGRSN